MTDPDQWCTIFVHTTEPRLNVGAVVRFKDYEADLLEPGLLRLQLTDRGEVYLFAPDQWQRFEAKPAPEHVAAQMDAEAQEVQA